MAYDSYLKYTGAELELLSSPDMVLQVEQSVRGGISYTKERLFEEKPELDEQAIFIDGKHKHILFFPKIFLHSLFS
jgi:hypothetical protein